MRPTRYPSRARALLCEGFPSSFSAFLLSREQVCNLASLYCAERGSASLWPSGWCFPARCLLPGVWAVAFVGSVFRCRPASVSKGVCCGGGGRSFFGGERFSWKMLLTANFSLVKLITVNLEEAKLPVKNFYTSSSAMFSSGSYWDVATALSFLFAGSCADSKSLAFEQECERERTRRKAGSFCLGLVVRAYEAYRTNCVSDFGR